MNLLKKKWFLVVALIVFMKPTGFALYGFPTINNLMNFLRVIFFLYILLIYIYRMKISIITFIIFLFFVSLSFSVFINSGDILGLTTLAITSLGICMMFEIVIELNSRMMIDSLFTAFCILCFTNYFLLLKYQGLSLFHGPDETYVEFSFLTIDNWLTQYTIPSILFAGLYSYYREKKLTKSAIALVVCVVLTVIKTWSGTGVSGCFIVVAFIVCIYQKSIEKRICNIRHLTVISIALFFIIVIFRAQNYFEFIIEGILNKRMDLTGRTSAWDNAIEAIKQSPIFGQGFGHKVYFGMNAHNHILETLVEGGIFSLVFYLLILVASGRCLMKYRNESVASLFVVVIFSFFIMMISESQVYSSIFYGILVISYHIPTIITQRNMCT